MNYSTFKTDVKLSKLGFGAMRLPQTEPGFGKPIDEPAAKEMVDYAMANGVNYYDTAYIYHGGKSEVVLGEALRKYPRESYYVADKFNVQANPDCDFQFKDQLARLGMDSIDFYLIHSVMDQTEAAYDESGCIPYFLEQKRLGKIKYLGFSCHGTPDCLRRMLKKNDWDFVQIQLNYYDWFCGNAKEMYEIIREKNLPIMVMEPIRGGMLANIAADVAARLPEGNASPAAWALRFVMNLPGIAVTLSGMSRKDQVVENIATASADVALSETDLKRIEETSRLLHNKTSVPCTGCRYCCDNCPQEFDIPSLLATYNEYKNDVTVLGDAAVASWRLQRLKALPEDKQPGSCLGCGACTQHCPQNIDIPAYMQEMGKYLK